MPPTCFFFTQTYINVTHCIFFKKMKEREVCLLLHLERLAAAREGAGVCNSEGEERKEGKKKSEGEEKKRKVQRVRFFFKLIFKLLSFCYLM